MCSLHFSKLTSNSRLVTKIINLVDFKYTIHKIESKFLYLKNLKSNSSSDIQKNSSMANFF